MKTVIIDNNLESLKNTEKTLEKINLTTIIGKFTCTSKAKKEVLNLCPELLILEVDLGEQNGLTLAKEIEKKLQNIKIIFLTTEANYAVDAFELKQVDFILKPCSKKRMTQAIKKLNKYKLKTSNNETHLISYFKSLHYLKFYESGDYNQVDLKWRTKYAKEMFAYLIVNQKMNMRKDVLIDLFWPDANVKDAHNRLYTTIHYIRKTIESANLPITITNYDNHYSVDLNGVKLDFEEWFKKIEKYKSVSLERLEENMNMYQGHFLEEENYLWSEFKTQKYRTIWLETIEYLIEQQIKKGNIYKAVLSALYYRRIEPYMEKPYYILLDLFAKLKDYDSLKREYKKLEQMLKEEYDTKPKKSLTDYLQ